MLEKKQKLYEGKAKILYKTQDPEVYIQYFKDDATAFNGQKKASLQSKGILNNQISSTIFKYLKKKGIKSHYVQKLNDREMAIRALKIFPIEVVLRNRIAGSLAKKLGIAEGTRLEKPPVLEFFYKDDALGDPMVSESCTVAMGWMSQSELKKIITLALKIHTHLSTFFDEKGIELIDYKLEFGKDSNGNILLADEISPDSCRLWEKGTEKKLDKDRFRRDLGNVVEAYQTVAKMIT